MKDRASELVRFKEVQSERISEEEEVEGGVVNGVHVDHSHCLCPWLASKTRPGNKRGCEKNCNEHL